MKIGKVFLIVGALVLVFLVWDLFFNDSGILQTAWNSIANSINGTWQSVTGDSSAKLLPSFGEAGVITEGQNLDSSGF